MGRKAKSWMLIAFSFAAQAAGAQCISGDCINGYGVYRYKNGEVYKGQFRNGVRDGQGTLTDKHKNILYSGHWYPEEKSVSQSASRSLLAMSSTDAEGYVDAEHAYYRAPLRKAVVFSPYKSLAAGKDDYYIVIEKSKYKMDVYDASDDRLIVSYPVVFGNDDLGDKMCNGDRKTPEGIFYIQGKKAHAKWDKYLALSYPSEESIEKFNERKAEGLIAANANIGGGIGLHGTWANDNVAVDRKDNWTSGCVSTKNCYIDELYCHIPVGTKVIIRK
ncbi:MAG: L,D-transpeptidase family protein [Bacteroidetes bacterium]|nr:L,D-transpeptidase family protein [Bacteroidota bacterium]